MTKLRNIIKPTILVNHKNNKLKANVFKDQSAFISTELSLFGLAHVIAYLGGVGSCLYYERSLTPLCVRLPRGEALNQVQLLPMQG